MNYRIIFISSGLAAAFLVGCGNAGDTAVAPIQGNNAPMTAERAAEISKPDPSRSAEENRARSQMAQEQLQRDRYYSQKYGSATGGK